MLDPGLKILLISNNEMYGIQKIQQDLAGAGFAVDLIAADEAVETIDHRKPALIIVNLNGDSAADLAFCQKLIRICDVPLIAIGSDNDEVFRASILSTTVDDFLVRPVNPAELTARVKNILRRAQKTPLNGKPHMH